MSYRGYEIRELRPGLVDIVRPPLGRYGSVEQAKRAVDHFLDRDCSAHRGEC